MGNLTNSRILVGLLYASFVERRALYLLSITTQRSGFQHRLPHKQSDSKTSWLGNPNVHGFFWVCKQLCGPWVVLPRFRQDSVRDCSVFVFRKGLRNQHIYTHICTLCLYIYTHTYTYMSVSACSSTIIITIINNSHQSSTINHQSSVINHHHHHQQQQQPSIINHQSSIISHQSSIIINGHHEHYHHHHHHQQQQPSIINHQSSIIINSHDQHHHHHHHHLHRHLHLHHHHHQSSTIINHPSPIQNHHQNQNQNPADSGSSLSLPKAAMPGRRLPVELQAASALRGGAAFQDSGVPAVVGDQLSEDDSEPGILGPYLVRPAFGS